MGTGNWELYNLKDDPAEATDLSEQYPELKLQLIEDWKQYAQYNDVYDHKGHYDELYRKNYMPEEDD